MNNSNSIWYEHFLNALHKKYPKKSQLTEALSVLLCIGKEGIYRRLRKEVTFSIYDIVKIAKAWGISIDNIVENISGDNHLFQLNTLPYGSPLRKDLDTMERCLNFLKNMASAPTSEYMEISNTLPKFILENYPALSRFHTFKWLYLYGNEINMPPFNQFTLPEELVEYGRLYCDEIRKIKHMSLMLDSLFIQYLINDIRYFESIYLLSGDDVQQLKQETSALLNDLESICIQGRFADTYNKVDLYISQISIDTNCCYYYSPTAKSCGIRTFIKSTAVSVNESICDKFRKWMLDKKRVSIPISRVNEKQRIEFFKQQQKRLDAL
jgi:hypothetical protein